MSNIVDAPIMLDVLISDVDSNKLHGKLSEILNKKYLSNTTQESDNVEGILFGDFQRLFCTMTLNVKGIVRNVHFLVDTGSPRTYICEEVLNKYNMHILYPDDPFVVKLNKREISVKVSQEERYKDLNLLGTDFLHAYGAKLFVDFEEKCFTIKFQTSDSNSNDNIERGSVYQGRGISKFFIRCKSYLHSSHAIRHHMNGRSSLKD